MDARKLYEEACKKYKPTQSTLPWESLSAWDMGCWERHAQRLTESIEAATKLLRDQGYTLITPENLVLHPEN